MKYITRSCLIQLKITKTLDVVLAKFEAHCTPKKNETYERYMFRSRVQLHNEPFDSFLTALRLKAQFCGFGTLKDSLVRDQIVFGVEDKKLRERLLRETDLSLEAAIKICHANELSQKHIKTFTEMSTAAPRSDGWCGVVSERTSPTAPANTATRGRHVLLQALRDAAQTKAMSSLW